MPCPEHIYFYGSGCRECHRDGELEDAKRELEDEKDRLRADANARDTAADVADHERRRADAKAEKAQARAVRAGTGGPSSVRKPVNRGSTDGCGFMALVGGLVGLLVLWGLGSMVVGLFSGDDTDTSPDGSGDTVGDTREVDEIALGNDTVWDQVSYPGGLAAMNGGTDCEKASSVLSSWFTAQVGKPGYRWVRVQFTNLGDLSVEDGTDLVGFDPVLRCRFVAEVEPLNGAGKKMLGGQDMVDGFVIVTVGTSDAGTAVNFEPFLPSF